MRRRRYGAAVLVVVMALATWSAPTYAAHATSPNWAGYVARAAAPFTAATARWTEPPVSCAAGTDTAAAFWVGLDGYSNSTVEQIGVQAKCEDGIADYYAWWQMWPSPVHDLPVAAEPVHPSDVLTAAVARTGDNYTLSLRSSAGWQYTTVQQASADDASAEWVASSPPLCHTCRYALLTDFGRVGFRHVEAAAGGALRPLASFARSGGPISLTMTGPYGVTRAAPGPIAPGGQAFTVTWHHD